MDKATLYDFLKRQELLSQAELDDVETLINQYPYFQTARLLEIKNMKSDPDSNDFLTKLAKASLLCSDRQKLFYTVKDGRYAQFFNNIFTPEAIARDRTEELLNTFFDTIATEEETLLPQTAQNAALTDYLAYMEMEEAPQDNLPENAQPLKHHDIIDDFIGKAETHEIFTPPTPQPESKASNHLQDPDREDKSDNFLTETLARIYIKQQKYEQALAIIERLSLNFPKKSVYFADQIRFLEYLIINEKNKKLN